MKRHMSVLMLYARGSIYKVFVLLVLMAALECGLFHWALGRYGAEIAAGTVGLETLVKKSFLRTIFNAAFVGLLLILQKGGYSSGNKMCYTFRRLSISLRAVELWQWAYNIGCFMILWMVQTVVALFLGLWYMNTVPAELVNHQTLVMAFYRSGFLHNMLPLGDLWCWFRNVLLMVLVGVATARQSVKERNGVKVSGWGTGWIVYVIVPWFYDVLDVGMYQFQSAVCAVILLFDLLVLWRGGKLEDDFQTEQQEQEQTQA